MLNPDYESGQAIRTMEAAGLSVTMPRLAVWMALSRATAPLLATEIHRTLLGSGASMSLSAIYSALKRLRSVGLVTQHDFDSGAAHYALASRPFRHRIVCAETGDEHWVDGGPGLHGVIAEFCREKGFKLCDYTLSVQVRST